MELRTRKNSPIALENGEEYSELQGFTVTTLVFRVVSKCPWMSTSDPVAATKSVKGQNFNQLNVKELMAVLIK